MNASVDSPLSGKHLSLEQLVGLLASANDPKIGYSGLFSLVEAGLVTHCWRVWRLRDLARIEDPPGRLSLLAGKTSFWRAWPVDDGVKQLPRTADARDNYDLSYLTMQDPETYWTTWLSADPDLVMNTLRAVEHQGRPAWRFTAPSVKGGSTVLTVDAELGLIVRAERADMGRLEEWTDLQGDASLDPSFFEYDVL